MYKFWTSLLLMVVLLTAPVASGQQMVEYVPPDALAYVSWQGLNSPDREYQASHLKDLMDNPQVKQFIDQLMAISEQQNQIMGHGPAGDLEQAINKFMPVLWDNAFALFIGKISVDQAGGQDVPQPQIVLMLRPRADDKAKILQQLRDMVKLGDAPPVDITEQEGMIIIVLAAEQGQQTKLSRLASNLGNNPAFISALATNGSSGKPAMVGYLNTKNLFDVAKRQAQRQLDLDGPGAPVKPQTVFTAMGLDNVGALLVTGYFKDKNFVTDVFVDAPSPRTGLLNIFDQLKLTQENLEIIPDTATVAMAVKLDPAALLVTLRQVADNAAPDQKGALDQILLMGSAFAGVNLQEDFINAMGPTWVVYADSKMNGGLLGTGIGMVNDLADPAKMDKTLAQMKVELVSYLKLMDPNRDLSTMVNFQTIDYQGLKVHTMYLPVIAISYTITDGKIFIAMSPQDLVRMVNSSRNTQNNITRLPAFQKTMARVQSEGASTIVFQNLPEIAPQGYHALMTITQLSLMGMANGQHQVLPLTIPPLDILLKNIEPVGMAFRTDTKGMHIRYSVPFPGSEYLSIDKNTVAFMIAPMTAAMLPALGAARQAARQMQSKSQARALGAACSIHMNESKAPPEIGQLAQGIITVKFAVSPHMQWKIPPNFDELPTAEQASWVRSNASYVLVTENFLKGENATLITVFERVEDAQDPNQIAVCWGDNHATLETAETVEKLLVEQTGKSMKQHYDLQVAGGRK